MALNPRAFSVTQDIEDINKLTSETATMLERLFENSPDASVTRIKVSPSFGLDGYTPTVKGGTITLIGTF